MHLYLALILVRMNTYSENFEKVVFMGFSNQWLDKNFEKETLKGFSNQLCQNAHLT